MTIRRRKEDLFWAFIFSDAYSLGYNFINVPPRSSWIEEFSYELLNGIDICNKKYCYSSKVESAISVANEILERGSISAEALARRFSVELKITNSIRKYGVITSEVVRLIRKGLSWHEAVTTTLRKYNIPDDEALYRVIPIVISYSNDAEITKESERQTIATHLHPSCIDSSITYALILHRVINGEDVLKILNDVITKSTHIERILVLSIKAIESLLNKSPKDVARLLNNNNTAISTLTTGLYCFLKSNCDIESSFTCSISIGGYVSGRIVVSSTLSSACGGFHKRFQSFIKVVENYELLESILNSLLNLKPSKELC